jgi:hypothetical protein
LYSIVEILASAYDTKLHLVAINDNGAGDGRDPRAALVCAATHCLSISTTPLFSTINSSRRHSILALLHDVSPSSATYDALADLPLARLRILAGALRAHNLSSLERALWACAVEYSRSIWPIVDPALLAALADADEWGREEIVVVDRMRRGSTATLVSMPTRSPPRKRARRTTHPRVHSPSPSPSPSPSSSSTTVISVASTPPLSSSSSSSSSSSARSLSESPVPAEIAEGSEGEEEKTMTRRRSRVGARSGSCVDLRSVLADALRDRKDLKEERRRASLRHSDCRRYGRSVPSPERESSCGEEEDTVALALPSEGDVLDLFAYEDPF